jgi:branched-subunit amino acid aminotransferase/4-amino-4-deoxychorismate lyase
VRVEVEGRPVDADPTPPGSIGHFTAMQVRRGAVRGLELHLRRLEGADAEMFGIELDRDRVRELVRRALGDVEDASVRVYVRRTETASEPETVVTVRPPGGIDSPQRLRPVDYLRPLPHLKHFATEQGEFRRVAQDAGFDDALLTDGLDVVAEAAIANVGFLDGPTVVWPDAPMLRGITMQLLEGVVPSASRVVRLREVSAFDGALVCNARGIAMVSAIDDAELPDASARIEELRGAYDAIPWDAI